MLKALGVILMFGGCIGIGTGKVKELDSRINVLRSLLYSLEVIARELEFRLSPMEQLLETAAKGTPEPVFGFFNECSAELKGGKSRPFFDIWSRLANERLYILKKTDLESFLQLGGILGRYDSCGQKQAVDRVLSILSQSLSDSLFERKNQGKVYCTLGATAGAFLVILLL